jgi:hypothetical protein
VAQCGPPVAVGRSNQQLLAESDPHRARLAEHQPIAGQLYKVAAPSAAAALDQHDADYLRRMLPVANAGSTPLAPGAEAPCKALAQPSACLHAVKPQSAQCSQALSKPKSPQLPRQLTDCLIIVGCHNQH